MRKWLKMLFSPVREQEQYESDYSEVLEFWL